MWELILGASPIVQLTLVLLVGASVASWAVIAYKAFELRGAERDSLAFIEAYTEGSVEAAYSAAREFGRSPLASLFTAGYRELSRVQKRAGKTGRPTPEQLETALQRLLWAQTAERHRLDRGLPFLATTGSSAPFVGLFGTVVGIMNAFSDIGASGSASLAVVAPGIAEALVATAVGLFAAIPAVIAYNYLGARASRLVERLDDFRIEYAEGLRRAIGRGP